MTAAMISSLVLSAAFSQGALPEAIPLSNGKIEARVYGGVPEERIGLSFKADGANSRSMGDLAILQTIKGIEIPKPIRLESWKRSLIVKTPDPSMAAADFDDSQWAALDDFDLPEHSGAVYRSTFVVPTPTASSPSVDLAVGPIDDRSTVYVNGVKVGSSDQWDQSYRYSITGKLKPGKNVVAIVVENEAGPGGMATRVEIFPTAPVAGYRRTFDAATGISLEEFEAAGVKYRREVFVSNADNVAVIRFEATKRGNVGLDVRLSPVDDFQTRAEAGNRLLLWNGSIYGQAFARFDGAPPSSNSATILFAALSARTTDFEKTCQETLDAAAKRTYADLKKRSIAAYRKT